LAKEWEKVGPRPVTLDDPQATRLPFRSIALVKLRRQTMVALDQRDAPRGGIQDVRGERAHARANLDEMVSRLRVETGDDGLGQVRIEEKILPEHLARPHTDLFEPGAEFCFGHAT
jgi:hypothetical protein